MALSDSEDDLISYGTPLEPLEEDEIPLKRPRLLEDQVVKDKQGRRRFHGAFTGGFSAGFFNTVGSLEGWTPTAFKSSKSQKQEISQKKPEDFMDEEDLSEFGIAPVVLKAKQDYTLESKSETHPFSKLGTLGTYVLQDLLKPARETVGIKLLKKMGWKPGQGVGPRLSKKEKETTFKIRQKTYGCQLPPDSLEQKEDIDSDSDLEWDDLDFAPSDYEPILCKAKTNFFGLGYEGLDKRPILSGDPSKKGKDSAKQIMKKLGFSSQAFGVGAFEEEDEDIYLRDDMSCYDFSLGDDQSASGSKLTEENLLTQVGILEGFVLGTKKPVRKKYILPVLPGNFKPHHKIRVSRFHQSPPKGIEISRKGSKLDFESRGEIINDSREETQEAKKRAKEIRELLSNVKITDNKFKPFASNPDKQERYENYLKLMKIGQKERLSDLQPLSMTNWDRERERIEFEKAALLFKPLTGGMEDRFSTASQPDDLSDPLAVVEKFIDENDDRRKAAKMNMFGPLTRKTEDWVPCSLLCKRFNIREPKKSSVQVTEKKPAKSYFSLFDAIESIKDSVKEIENPKHSEVPSSEILNKEEPEIFPLEEKTLTNIQNIQDKTGLFKAIFLASDDEEESAIENLSNASQNRENLGENDILYEEKLINSKRNLSPPSGIFKNLDLELLTRGRKVSSEEPRESDTKNEVELQVETLKTDSPTNLVYGPKMPEKLSAKANFLAGEQELEDGGVWVVKKIHAGRKHKKKEKKGKKIVHKSKHKHKKHKR